jgi:hypothetical protein
MGEKVTEDAPGDHLVSWSRICNQRLQRVRFADSEIRDGAGILCDRRLLCGGATAVDHRIVEVTVF